MRSLGLTLAGVLAAFLLLYVLVLGALWLRQEALLFYPQALPADHRLATAPDVNEVSIEVPGATLSALHLRLPQPRGVVFFLHGNAGHLGSWFSRPDWYRRANVDLVMVDYRGYGKSTGRIESEAQLRADVRAAWEHFAPMYAGRPVVVYGRSLGSGLAVGLAEQLGAAGRPPALTLLVSPYTSLRDLAREVYPWVPSAVLRYPMDTAALLPRLKGPVLLVHGGRDTLIPPAHSLALQRLRPQTRVEILPQAGHNDVQEDPRYEQILMNALTQL